MLIFQKREEVKKLYVGVISNLSFDYEMRQILLQNEAGKQWTMKKQLLQHGHNNNITRALLFKKVLQIMIAIQ